MYFFKINILIN